MRYRIFKTGKCIGVFADRHSFTESFIGNDPNYPIGGVIKFEDIFYVIFDYNVSEGSSKNENEFHEVESDWFANVSVNRIRSELPISQFLEPLEEPIYLDFSDSNLVDSGSAFV